MALNSINTNIAAYFAQANIGKASTSASLSIARLSSGNRIVRASDDVAALSAGTSLRTSVTTLRMALINTSQGSSLLQVADGALGQVTDILQRQKAIAVQAGSGSLSDNERSFLNQEFQNLVEEIDRIVSQTNFNGVALLDGSLSEKVTATDVDTAATAGSGRIGFNDFFADTEILILNGVTFEADSTSAITAGNTAFSIAGSVAETIDSLVTVLNGLGNGDTSAASLTNADIRAISEASYSRSGSSLVITARNGGALSETYTVLTSTSTALSAAGEGNVNMDGSSSVVNLGSSNGIGVESITTVASAAASAAATPFQIGDILTAHIGTAGTTFALVTIATNDSLESIVNRINSATATHGFTARIIGASGAYNIQLEHTAVTANNSYLVANAADITTAGLANSAANISGLAVNTTTTNNFSFYLAGGDDLGIGAADTVGIGTIGNDLVTAQSQQQASVSLIFPEIADDDLTSTTNFGQASLSTITIGGVAFAFTEAGGGPTEATVGTTLEETLDNMVATINNYSGTQGENYILNQLEAVRSGREIVIRSVDYGDPVTLTGGTVTITQANLPSGASLTNSGNLDNGATGGITTSGVTNADFVGTISGFAATYNGTTDTVDFSVTVGDHLYTATTVDTTPASATAVRFTSQTGGGFFDVEFAANQGQAVTSQSDADLIAQRLDAAFSSITFYQNHEISSYTGSAPILTNGSVTGNLIGTSFELQGTDFTDVAIDYVRVTAPQGSSENGSFIVSINGEEYRADSNIGSQLGAYTSIKLVNELDANKVLTFNTGDTPIEFSTDEQAAAFQAALQEAFGVGDGSAELQFQVGTTVEDTLSVGINNVTTTILYAGISVNVLTAEDAAIASDTIDDALDIVTSVRAEVGALQSRFNFAAANVESAIQNQDAARGVLLDTDIASESTAFATAQVQLQAGIAVLAQANLLPQNLLKLIG